MRRNSQQTCITEENSLSIDSNPGKSDKKSNEKDNKIEERSKHSNNTGKNKHEIGPVIPISLDIWLK